MLLSYSGVSWGAESSLARLSQDQLNILRRLTITGKGIGPVKIGMHVDEASKLLGIDIKQTKYQYGDVSCHSYALGNNEFDWVIRFLTKDEKIGVIDIYDPAISMLNGLAVGKSMKDVQFKYAKQYIIQPAHEWPDKSIVVESVDGIRVQFTGPLLIEKDVKNPAYPVDKVNELVQKISIGIRGVGSVEGCL